VIRGLAGPLIAALLIPAGMPVAAPAGDTGQALRVLGADGAALALLPLASGGEFCLRWNHSVTGGKVADCFVIADGRMVLDRSYLHDYAAGLGEVAGRGVVRPAEGGGYWIEAIDEPVRGNRLLLRVGGRAVDHRLTSGGRQIDLSDLAAGQRVILQPAGARFGEN
jgi:hypothetical protein